MKFHISCFLYVSRDKPLLDDDLVWVLVGYIALYQLDNSVSADEVVQWVVLCDQQNIYFRVRGISFVGFTRGD